MLIIGESLICSSAGWENLDPGDNFKAKFGQGYQGSPPTWEQDLNLYTSLFSLAVMQSLGKTSIVYSDLPHADHI